MADINKIPEHVVRQIERLAEEIGCEPEDLLSDIIENITIEKAKQLLKEKKITKKEYEEIIKGDNIKIEEEDDYEYYTEDGT